MTSQTDVKTNEFLLRRKIRLQQVREQSKNIAKKIRDRAYVGKLQFITNTDKAKEQEYRKHQNNLIQHLQAYYQKGVDNLGDGHRNACEVDNEDQSTKQLDKSKLRGKEAVAELRRKKQEKLDEHKRLLDRKLQAREEANEISREKSLSIANKLSTKHQLIKNPDKANSNTVKGNENDATNNNENGITNENSQNLTDMSTQWDLDVPSEFENSVPALNLLKDATQNINQLQPENNKKMDLFALSDEMPASLRGGLTNASEQTAFNKPSTLVSQYLQNRNLNLRDHGPTTATKHANDLPKLRQTILRTRSSATEDNTNLCRQNKSINHKLGKKQSVTVYNHSTRDSRVLPCEDETLVVRDECSQEDAYSQASKINSLSQLEDHNKPKVQTTRNKVAVSKLNVEKEYNETVSFLNTLQRNKSPKPVIRNAYKTDKQQKAHKSKHQQKLEYEFNKIENECRRKQKCQKSSLSHRRSLSRSPVRTNIRDDEEDNDFEYSWMPIPESDATLAIHTIPTAVKESRVGNNVKFSNIDGYHEYRSRHKHTPPTKDVGLEKQRLNVPKQIYLDDNESSSSITDSSSIDNTELPSARNHNDVPSNTLTDSEHIVIYKVLNQRKAKKERKQKLINDIIKALRDKEDKEVSKKDDEHIDLKNFVNANTLQNKSFEQLKEGIYKTVTENGDSVTNCVVDPTENTLLNGQDAVAGPSRSISKTKTEACKHAQAQWDIENKTERTDVRCVACQCEQCHPKAQSSISTSATTFKTATQVIANDINMLNERFTKLIDDKEKESQKLYVGATGLFKDDAYEVVIQLRKKDSANTQTDQIENVSDKKVSSSELNIEEHRPTETSNITGIKNSDDLRNIRDQITQDSAVLETLPDQTKITQDSAVLETLPEQTINDSIEDVKDVKKMLTVRNSPVVDKADTTLLSENVLKPCDQKTAYTQTSFCSPNPKSTLNQMSSSASTSYMSPPESLLPRYLRNKHSSGDQQCQQSLEAEEMTDSYPSNHRNCVCRKCRHPRKIVLKVHSENQTERKLETPPPSLRSTISDQNVHDIIDIESQDTKHKHNQCRKKRNHKTTRVCVDSLLRSDLSMKISKESKLNIMRESRAALINTNEYKMKNSIELNPVVKTYVNKLLSLNKESLKAIEVVKQDCSSISTPGSSIIDLPNNFERNNSKMQKKISLEQIKEDIIRQLVDKINDKSARDMYADKENTRKYEITGKNSAIKISKKKQVHKVKSIKVPKNFVKKPNNSPQMKKPPKKFVKKSLPKSPFNTNIVCCNMATKPTKATDKGLSTLQKKHKPHNIKNIRGDGSNISKHFTSAVSSYTNLTPAVKHYENMCNEMPNPSVIPVHISTQTSDVSDKEINFITVAESKLQNMEKIADLTEKCTMRLSNLAKVLDEVRKNKSAAYSQISTPDPNSDFEIDKDIETVDHKTSITPTETQNKSNNAAVPIIDNSYEGIKTFHNISLINDIPNPQSKTSDQDSTPKNLHVFNIEQICNKLKGKPPPALVKSKLKDCQEIIIPHELSTVIEVDSPISAKLKSRSPYTEELSTCIDKSKEKHAVKTFTNDDKIRLKDNKTNPDILENDKGIQKKISNNSIAQMIDLNQFNKIMLQPFISINDYAKDYKMLSVDEASNIDDVGKNDAIADDISSLHSEGSLPDVVSELLKRNIIAEPFKFDSGNSTTISTDTTLSMLTRNKHKKDQKKTVIRFENKENLCDTSDSLSVSSNPDLEHAFKKIGMGWASSTLKRTKERLALSSSSNTSSSSITHFKIKNNKDVPALVTDSLSSAFKVSKSKNLDRSKTIEQQTSFSNSMTVKEFLTNELAKRITFASTSNKSEGDEEFISLYETKMPEEMKQSVPPRADYSSDQSQNNVNRARTSTPVQLFKSMTYHSSTNSNTSNGLFSNIDELSSVKGSQRNQSTSDQDNLTIPNLSLKTKKNSDCSKSE